MTELMPEGVVRKPTEEQIKLQVALEKFKEEFAARPFSQRHPDKKNVKCPFCTAGRHPAPVCVPRFSEGREQFTIGRSFVQRKRLTPHPSAKKLQLVERTRELAPKYEVRGLEPINTMKLARAEAGRNLKAERKAESKRVRQQQKRSRKINRK